MAPGFWSFLEQKADEGLIGSSERVYQELREWEDELSVWAEARHADGFFIEPNDDVQRAMQTVADYVVEKYEAPKALDFLAKADPWLVAHAMVDGGKVVTLEKWQPLSQKPKIPVVCDEFGVEWIDLWTALRDLGLRLVVS